MKDQILQWLAEENYEADPTLSANNADWIIKTMVRSGSFGSDAPSIPIIIGKPSDGKDRLTLQAEFKFPADSKILQTLDDFHRSERRKIIEYIYTNAAEYLPLSVYVQVDNDNLIQKIFCFDEVFGPNLRKNELFRSLRTMANFYALIMVLLQLRLQLI